MNMIIERGLHEAEILLYHPLRRPPAFQNIALKSPGEHDVRIAFDEDLEIEEIANRWIEESEETFDDDDGRSVQIRALVRSLVKLEGVVWNLDAFASFQGENTLGEEVVVEGRGFVEVVVRLEGQFRVLSAEGLVEIVLRDDDDVV